jgi:hypothetical protein
MSDRAVWFECIAVRILLDAGCEYTTIILAQTIKPFVVLATRIGEDVLEHACSLSMSRNDECSEGSIEREPAMLGVFAQRWFCIARHNCTEGNRNLQRIACTIVEHPYHRQRPPLKNSETNFLAQLSMCRSKHGFAIAHSTRDTLPKSRILLVVVTAAKEQMLPSIGSEPRYVDLYQR